MATIVLLFLIPPTSSVFAMSPELARIIFALTDFENLQSGRSVAKPRLEPGTCRILSRTVNPLVQYSISYILFLSNYCFNTFSAVSVAYVGEYFCSAVGHLVCLKSKVMPTVTESGQESVLKRSHGLSNIGFILAKLVRVSVHVSGKNRY